jgi:hypothetical protein
MPFPDQPRPPRSLGGHLQILAALARAAGFGRTHAVRRLDALAYESGAMPARLLPPHVLADASDAVDELFALLDDDAEHEPGGLADRCEQTVDEIGGAWAERLCGEREAA